jgi:hypothetical protein
VRVACRDRAARFFSHVLSRKKLAFDAAKLAGDFVFFLAECAPPGLKVDQLMRLEVGFTLLVERALEVLDFFVEVLEFPRGRILFITQERLGQLQINRLALKIFGILLGEGFA